MAAEGEAELDSVALNRFSRQNAALGAETTAKLIKMKILIVGLQGIGVETAKNLTLQGAGGVTLYDNTPTTIADVGLNFFLTPEDAKAGTPRAVAVAPRLQELNPICSIKVSESLSDEVIRPHSALVITDPSISRSELIRLNQFCRSNKVSFFYAVTGGIWTSVFVDHGDHHIVNDPNGARPVQKLITSISKVEEGEEEDECLIRYDTPEGQPPESIDEGTFEISDVTGMEGVNGLIVNVSHPGKDAAKTVRAKIPNFGSMPKYVSGGILTEKKVPKAYPMSSLEEKMKNPGELIMTDLLTFCELHLHVAFVALLEYRSRNDGPAPRPSNEEDIKAVVEIAKELISSGAIALDGYEVDADVVSKVAKFAGVELQPMGAFVGGVLAQEVVKCTGKFTPLPGFLHFAAFEALGDPQGETSPRGTRYDNLAQVYGWGFVEKLGNLQYFMVGCGALGCEFLKNFALNGVCCGEKGRLHVTDADRIELSNLSRQFLFREVNVGHPKSRAACAMAHQMNPDFKVNSLELFVGPNTEDSFHDEFWIGLDGVCNALDNMEARHYVDAQCVRYEKPLLESGTMGTSGNVDTISPFKTKTYRDGGNAAEGGGVPMCTLRNFPHLTDHCIEWARDQFELMFAKLPKSISKYMGDPDTFEKEKKVLGEAEIGQAIFESRCALSMLKAAKSPSVETAAQLAYDLFHMLFRDKIMDLQNAFPPNSRIIDKEGNDKGPFWGEKKRYPTAAKFNPDDESHWSFMTSATCLFAVILGVYPAKKEDDNDWLKECRSREWILKIISSLSIPEYAGTPVSDDAGGSEVSAEEKEKGKQEQQRVLENLLKELRETAKSPEKLPEMEPADFEKDDDLNFHIEFITAASNLRCDNYSIRRTDFQSCKIIAGKIIAAIATTTAAVCGLVILELFKIILGKSADDLMNRQIGLAVNAYTSFTQDPPKKFSTRTEEYEPPADSPDLPEDAFDESGKLKKEYVVRNVLRCYPEDHSVWDKLVVNGSLTLNEFEDWFTSQHKLTMTRWDFVVGYKMREVENKKEKMPVTTPIFPPKPVLDPSLLPPLDMKLQQATMAIMRNQKAKPTQQYIAFWKECQANGAIPSPEEAAANATEVITGKSTLKEILLKMEALAEKMKKEKKIDQNLISHIASRHFWVIPGGETPSCEVEETGEGIAAMAAVKILLK